MGVTINEALEFSELFTKGGQGLKPAGDKGMREEGGGNFCNF